MKPLKLSSLVVALLIFALANSACGPVGNKIVKYSDKATRTVERLRAGQVIDQEEANRLLPLIADVRSAGAELASIEAIIANTDPEKASKAERVRVATQAVIASLRRLESQGVLRVKNPDSRRQLQRALAGASIILDFTQ